LSITSRETPAAEWSAEPAIAVKGVYNSNLTLSKTPEEVWGHWISPSVRFAGSTERLHVSAKAAGDFVTYYGAQNRSLTNLFFPVTARYSGEQDVVSLESSFTRDNTLRTELEETGVVLNFTQRNLWSINPSWTHSVTERVSFQLGYQYQNTAYEDGRRLGLSDYTVHGGNLGWSYKLTERDDVRLTGSYAKVDLPDSGLTIDNRGAALSITHAFSEATSLSAFGGPKWIDQTLRVGGASISDDQIIWSFGGSMRTTWVEGKASLIANRDVNVSGIGALVQTDRLVASISQELTETITVSLAGATTFVERISVQSTGLQTGDTRVISATPTATWRLNDWWSLEASYSYAHRMTDSTDATTDSIIARGHSTFLKLTYSMPKLSMSR
jgi:hypothetical protein